MDYSLVHLPSEIGPYGAGVEEDNCCQSSREAGPGRDWGPGGRRSCASAGRRRRRRRRRRRGWCRSRTASADAGRRRWAPGRAPGDPTRAAAARQMARRRRRWRKRRRRRRSGARGGAPGGSPTTPPRLARRCPSGIAALSSATALLLCLRPGLGRLLGSEKRNPLRLYLCRSRNT